MKREILVFWALFTLKAHAEPNEYVHHPVPKEPIFLAAAIYPTIQKQLTPPPAPHSPEQKKDEAELLHLQRIRTQAQCQKASAEVRVNLASFFGAQSEGLKDSEIAILSGLIEQVRNDSDFLIQQLKKDFPRPRPYVYLKKIEPCVPKEVTGAYPSGHSTLAALYAMILSDFFPSKKALLHERGLEIGKNRILSGMHHPTDVSTGRDLAKLIYQELQQSKKYQQAFADAALKLNKTKESL